MSHFSTVKTELRQLGPLMTALQDLGYSPEQGERQVRGYRGQTVQADISVEVQDGGDIGFRWNAQSGVYELVTDLDLWKQQIPVERFLTRRPHPTLCIEHSALSKFAGGVSGGKANQSARWWH